MATDTTNTVNSILNSGTPAQTASGAAGTRLAEDFDNFLLLLTTQLKNQDPTAPMDANQFTQQLVSFAGVEQSIATNTNLEKLLALSSTDQINSAVNYIGKQLTAAGNSAALQDGRAEFIYELPTAATQATISITNAAGQVYYSGPVDKGAGTHSFVWDGKSLGGADLPDGEYFFSIAAKDISNKDITAGTFSTGVVSSVTLDNGAIMLKVGDMEIPLEDVISISAAQPVEEEDA